MEKAWMIHLPGVNLNEAIRRMENGEESPIFHNDGSVATEEAHEPVKTVPPSEQPESSPAEYSNAEDYEFDESQDFDNSTDGMGFLVVEPRKAGYMGPQSGIAALKFLQTLPLYMPINSISPLSLDDFSAPDSSTSSTADIRALAKPRDGSWPLLYNIVLAIGAFVGDTDATKCDIPFYRAARKHLSMDIPEKGSLSYVQALVLMANYLQKRNKPNSGFVLIGIGFSMALAIGLHREFGLPRTTPFTMELRRRAWWTLFIFVSGAQLTLGRPAVSLVGVNVRLPSDLDDQDLAVDMEELPEPKDGPTVTSCLIAQVKLAKIANMVQVELLTNQIPSSEKAMSLDRNIASWHKELPAYFDGQRVLKPWFEIPKKILIWRSFHLRVVLNRPILFQAITARSQLATSIGPIGSCLTAAEECVESICDFLESGDKQSRGLAWYATYWLITASFVQATCYLYDPAHGLAPGWKAHLKRAVDCLSILGSAHGMALRARDILQRLLDQGRFLPLPNDAESGTTVDFPQGDWREFWGQSGFPRRNYTTSAPTQVQASHALPAMDMDMSFPWYTQASSDAELLDAAGGIMLQSYSDAAGPYFENGSWMPA
ncbi:hypothetical protein W97_00756 [Coniosporium apollinis CBS 100218]|uniref:Xylanolytic transcriptional activator regulatory domain-containing protein n=1 Tax=Coniosporium apollinis (strain CBS 100218) TaxID=1168221 RepID=R7YIU0_CONA1|nr:uncharacterized protein W97_00756 [Coniosporium apollinis CBS 100218]EON61541.1 hypothetical protein W97_00756 [Coniosporium apollinis CBS 100218]